MGNEQPEHLAQPVQGNHVMGSILVDVELKFYSNEW